MAFKVGDRVIGKAESDDPKICGHHGVITSLEPKFEAVMFDSPNFNGWGNGAREWYVELCNLKLEIVEIPQNGKTMFPTEASERKKIPLGTGLLDYFPQALIEVAKVSFAGNQQHNPGEPLHWARGKSMDQDDTILRHYMERGKM